MLNMRNFAELSRRVANQRVLDSTQRPPTDLPFDIAAMDGTRRSPINAIFNSALLDAPARSQKGPARGAKKPSPGKLP
jgi:hypothetical protein